jgi:uncharacterized protein (TIGR02147 family)
MASAAEIDVFGYLDYRAYLRDYYQAKKDAGRGFSYRAFSRRAGLKSPNYLKLVIDGDRNLTPQMAERFGKAVGLAEDALGYYIDLVAFNQAKSSAERNTHYGRLSSFRGYKKAHALDLAQAAYHSTWYIPAIRELAARTDFVGDAEWIAKMLLPPISRGDAQKALSILLDLGLLTKNADGRIVQTESLVSTGPETRGLHIGNYHRGMMERAAESIDLVPAGDRDISSLTLCLGEDGLRHVKERVQRFRRELLELSELEDDPRRVIQVNLQLFPLTSGD